MFWRAAAAASLARPTPGTASQCTPYVGRRGVTKLLVRYVPGPREIAEFRALVKEYSLEARKHMKVRQVRTPVNLDKETSLGFAYLDFDHPDRAKEALHLLQHWQVTTLPSGRPPMVATDMECKIPTSLLLRAASSDPWVVKYADVDRHINEILTQYGAVREVFASRSYGWAHGWAYIHMDTTHITRKLPGLLSSTTPPGFDFPWAVTRVVWQPPNKEGQTTSGCQTQDDTTNTQGKNERPNNRRKKPKHERKVDDKEEGKPGDGER